MKPDCVRTYNISYKHVFFWLCFRFSPYILFIEITRRLTLLLFITDTLFPSVHKLKAEWNHQIYFLFFIDYVHVQCVMNFMTAEYLTIWSRNIIRKFIGIFTKKKLLPCRIYQKKKEQKIRAVTACSVRSVLARECMYVCMRMCIY